MYLLRSSTMTWLISSSTSYSFKKTFRIHPLSTCLAILPPGQVVPAACMDNDAVCMLCILSRQPDSYNWRPTQEQVDGLTRFTSREPQWWVDVMPSKFYRWIFYRFCGGIMGRLDWRSMDRLSMQYECGYWFRRINNRMTDLEWLCHSTVNGIVSLKIKELALNPSQRY
jgi:hypothetical protein